MLVADGRLHLDRSPPIPRWQRAGDPRAEITLRQLMQMRSGLRHEEKAEPVYTSPEVRMMFLDGRDDMAGWAEAQPLESEPGREFDYSTPTAMILADLATQVLSPGDDPAQRQRAMDEFLAARLAGPLGLDSLTAEYDASGTMMGGSMVWATAPDWARLWRVPAPQGLGPRRADRAARVDRVHDRPQPARAGLRRDAAAQPRLGREREVLFPDDGPASLFAAVGHLGQYILVSPRQKLVVVRLGKTDEPDRDALVDALAKIVALYPKRRTFLRPPSRTGRPSQACAPSSRQVRSPPRAEA